MPRQRASATATPNVTQAYETVAARLTQALANPTPSTSEPVPTDSGVASPTPSLTATQGAQEPSQTPGSDTPAKRCDQAAAGSPIDVTVPDDTVMQPGQVFTKIWRLKNVGTCTWTSSYAITFFSGEKMGAPTVVPIPGVVAPGQSIDIAVDLQAPQEAGAYQGNWKLLNANGVLFGIGPEGSSPFWVRIKVVQTPTPSPTAPTATPTPTPTLTQTAIEAEGTLTLQINDKLDLDTNQVNNDNGEDLVFSIDDADTFSLTPLDGVTIGIFGIQQPQLSDCQSAEITSEPLILTALPSSVYVCYRTNQGLPGWLHTTELNEVERTLSLIFQTWALP